MNLENNLHLAKKNCDEQEILSFVSSLEQPLGKGGPLTLWSSRHLALALALALPPSLPRVMGMGQVLQRPGFALEVVSKEELGGN